MVNCIIARNLEKCHLPINKMLKKTDVLRAWFCHGNGGRKLEGAGKDCTEKLLVADLNRAAHLSVLLAEDVRQALEQHACLDEGIEREALLPDRVIAVQQALDEVRSQTVAHLRQHYNTHRRTRLSAFHDYDCDVIATTVQRHMQHRVNNCDCEYDTTAMWLRPEINAFVFPRGCSQSQHRPTHLFTIMTATATTVQRHATSCNFVFTTVTVMQLRCDCHQK